MFRQKDIFNKRGTTKDIRNLNDSFDWMEDNPRLKVNQNSVIKFLKVYPDVRGLLLVHGMGTGKTRLAAHIYDHFRKDEKYDDYKFIFCSPASIIDNFKQSVKAEEPYLSYKVKDVETVSSNSSTFFRNLVLANARSEVERNVYKTNESLDIAEGALEKTVIIIDEAHNFFSTAVNAFRWEKEDSDDSGRSVSEDVYNLLMRTKQIKLFFMTGTPVKNDPYEYAAALNLVKGYLDYDEKTTLFPSTKTEFMSIFIDKETQALKEKNVLTGRSYGLISYYDREFFPEEEQKMFPQFDIETEYVPMSKDQFDIYLKEAVELKRKERKSQESGFGSNKDVYEREFKNKRYEDLMAIPKYKVKLRIVSTAAIQGSSTDVSPEEIKAIIENMEFRSPKIKKIIENLEDLKRKSVIYSGFHAPRLILEEYFRNRKDVQFFSITGNTKQSERQEIVNKYNESDGYKTLFITQAGAEGIDLKGVRDVHVIEPYWNNTRINQVITRAVRYGSHMHLPPHERNVTVKIYVSTFGNNITPIEGTSFTKDEEICINETPVDVHVLESATKKDHVYNDILSCISQAAIDCHYYNRSNPNRCLNTIVDGRPLFNIDIAQDVAQGGYRSVRVSPTEEVLEIQSLEDKTIYRYRILVDSDNYKTMKIDPISVFPEGSKIPNVGSAAKNKALYTYENDFVLNTDKYNITRYKYDIKKKKERERPKQKIKTFSSM